MIRGDNRAYDGILQILSLFQDRDVCKDAARSLIILSRESDGIISKSNFSVIRVSAQSNVELCRLAEAHATLPLKLLHRQRLYSTVIPKLVQGFHASGETGSSLRDLVVC